MKSRTRVSSAMLVLVCLSLLAIAAHAQYGGSLQGTVTDAQGAVVPGAKVTLIDKETNRTLEATSDSEGHFVFNGLAPRPYKMEVTKDGFQKKVLDDTSIVAEQSNALNVQLDIGQATETVNVTDAAPFIGYRDNADLRHGNFGSNSKVAVVWARCFSAPAACTRRLCRRSTERRRWNLELTRVRGSWRPR